MRKIFDNLGFSLRKVMFAMVAICAMSVIGVIGKMITMLRSWLVGLLWLCSGKISEVKKLKENKK